ncbi:hypothetical protein [Leptolyngbya sp. FACHB-16]|uniref:hypothetical protein n=1 Tax=unclassified Leptolyngbya TaxID=2650499 RepID=UPI0016827C7C|nr:hypothetical protein [Leptolyngbya sp. FACHB-16]MBD2155270.1 hypothetical protein [Leptolyngbya sp. FACHB-16]
MGLPFLNGFVLFSLRFPGSTFIDGNRGDRLSHQAQLSNGHTLPAWLRFNPQNLFQGLLPVASEGAYNHSPGCSRSAGSTGVQPLYSAGTLRFYESGHAQPHKHHLRN